MLRRTLLTLGCVLPLVAAVAGNGVHPGVYMDKLTLVKSSERGGDEVYMAVTIFPKNGQARHFEIPENPLYWKSSAVSQLHDLKLWDRPMHEGEGLTMILSLIDRDAEPWNTDDLLGSVKLHLKNDNGKLVGMWVMPNNNDFMPTAVTLNKPQELTFSDSHGEYKVVYSVRTEKD